jgi:hypothetical protein
VLDVLRASMGRSPKLAVSLANARIMEPLLDALWVRSRAGGVGGGLAAAPGSAGQQAAVARVPALAPCIL